jgi:hypothetical protein
MERLDISLGKAVDHSQRVMKEVSSVLEAISLAGETILEDLHSQNTVVNYVRLIVPSPFFINL